MDVTKRNDVSIYCLSSGPTIPEWLGERARRNLSKKDDAVRRRIELLQDFQMPASSSKLVQSADGRYIMVAGTYPPRIRCYDLHQLTLKFERYVNAGVVDMVMLGEDYGKVALLQEDRTIAFHAHYGAHESIRIPTFGRAMAYEPMNCELLVAAKGNQIYRVNLDEGRFSEPWTFDAPSNNNNVSTSCITVNPSYPSACVGCDDGIVRFYDSRAADTLLRPILKLDVTSATVGYGYYGQENNSLRFSNPNEVKSLAFDPTGMYLAAGTGGGLVALYDVRSSRPLFVQEHKDGLPIHTIQFHSQSGMVLSGDERLVKAWRYKLVSTGSLDDTVAGSGDKASHAIGAVRVNIEGSSKLTNFILAGDESDPTGSRSGVILCAADQPKMESYFVPALGVAPKWCSFLDSITEELEERDLSQEDGAADELVRSGKESIYDNYKFVTRDDLEKLGVSNLIGTPLLRGYMHGFFMNVNLYNRVKAVANPFEYEEYQKKKLKERLDAKRSSRIAPKETSARAKPAVNPELAVRLQHKAEDSTKGGKVAKNVLSDDRFGSLFTNPDFQINEDDEDFRLRNPSGIAAIQKKKNNLDSDDEDDEATVSEDDKDQSDRSDNEEAIVYASDNDDEEEEEEDAASVESDSDDDGFRGGKVRGEAYDTLRALSRLTSKTKVSEKAKKKGLTLYDTEGLDEAGALGLAKGDTETRDRARQRLEEMEIPLGERLAHGSSKDAPVVRVSGGSKEVSFIPRDTKRKLEAEKEASGEVRGKRNRRGIKELKFKTPFKNRR